VLKQPTDLKVLDALTSLKDQSEFREFADWIQASLEILRRANDTLDGVHLYRSQGACLTLQSLLEYISTAKGTAHLLRSKRG
jgi:hypothetical protein